MKSKETDYKKQIEKFSDADPEVIAELNKKVQVIDFFNLYFIDNGW